MIIRFEDKNKYNPSKVLERLSDVNIYEYFYGSNIKANTAHKCCFHSDSTPSLHFKRLSSDKLIYNCFGCGQKGDVFSFVSNLHNISYKEAVKLVVDTLEGNKSDYIKIKPIDDFKFEISNTEIYPYFRKFSESDLNYWNTFCISLKTLNKYNVNVCDRVFMFGKKDPLELKYSPSNPIFSYTFRTGGYKVYRPLNPTKRGKFFSNVNEWDVQGLAQLPESGKTLIITSSLKDVMVIDECELPSIAPQGEGISIPEKIVDYLYACFEDIYVLYDSDDAGYKYSKKISEQFGFKSIFIPEEFGVKDISDFAKKYGLEKTKSLLQKLVNG